MKRTYRREFVMNKEEADELSRKAKIACVSESQLIRMLIAGYMPPATPDDQFYEAMNLIAKFGDRIDGMRVGRSDPELLALLKDEAVRWHKFQSAIEQHYLAPKRSEMVWQ